MQRGLDELLAQEVTRAGLASFGVCITCRFFRQNGRSDDAKGPHHCMLLDDALSEGDTARICIEHQPAP